MQKLIRLTEDGSHTIHIPEMGVTYHSTHGAIAESRQVYIEAGLSHFLQKDHQKKINIFEMGFGTGLNALLSWQFARTHALQINYTSIESDPLQPIEYEALNYGIFLELSHELLTIHETTWNIPVQLDPFFCLEKINVTLEAFEMEQRYHCIFFDAFSPTEQPELWTKEMFQKIYLMMLPGAILVTYCSKSAVRKAMQEAGLEVSKIPGPRGKREMVRAIRLS